MKNYVFIVALLLLSLGCAQQNPEADKAGAEAAIKGFYGAVEKFDFATMRAFCTPDFHAIEDGKTYNSIDDFIAMAKSMEGMTAQINMNFVRTDIDKNVAFSIVKFDATFTKDKVDWGLKTIENYVLKKVEGKWLIDFYQSTYLNKAPSLEKGTILGLHEMKDYKLAPGVTIEQVEEFVLNKFMPAFNELANDFKMVPLKSIRGDSKGELAMAYYLASAETMTKYFPKEGVQSEEAKALFQKIQDLRAEFGKMVTVKKDIYNDWLVE